MYEYFLRLPRIRFLLADDPGAGKTIMAGLLLKELKARGLVRRTLIVTTANLTFQWQRELADKFREKFDVIRGDVLRTPVGRYAVILTWTGEPKEARSVVRFVGKTQECRVKLTAQNQKSNASRVPSEWTLPLASAFAAWSRYR